VGGSPELVGRDEWHCGHDRGFSCDQCVECTGGDPEFVGSVHRDFNRHWEWWTSNLDVGS
jgi:hypothetical protein